MLQAFGIQVAASVALTQEALHDLNPFDTDILLVEVDDEAEERFEGLYDFLADCDLPVLFNDSNETERDAINEDKDFGRKLVLKLVSLLPS